MEGVEVELCKNLYTDVGYTDSGVLMRSGVHFEKPCSNLCFLHLIWGWQAVHAMSFFKGGKGSWITSECSIINVFSFLLAEVNLFSL